MNYKVRAFRVFMKMGQTKLEDYERDVPNFTEAVKEEDRLRSIGEYVNIRIERIKKPQP